MELVKECTRTRLVVKEKQAPRDSNSKVADSHSYDELKRLPPDALIGRVVEVLRCLGGGFCVDFGICFGCFAAKIIADVIVGVSSRSKVIVGVGWKSKVLLQVCTCISPHDLEIMFNKVSLLCRRKTNWQRRSKNWRRRNRSYRR